MMKEQRTEDLETVEGGLTIWCPLFPIDLALVDDTGELIHLPMPPFPLPYPPCGGPYQY